MLLNFSKSTPSITNKDINIKTKPIPCIHVICSDRNIIPSVRVVAGSKIEIRDVLIVPIKFTALIKKIIGKTVQTIGKAAKCQITFSGGTEKVLLLRLCTAKKNPAPRQTQAVSVIAFNPVERVKNTYKA